MLEERGLKRAVEQIIVVRVPRVLGDLVEYRDEVSKVKIGDKNGLKSYSFMMRHNVMDASGRLNKNQVAEDAEFEATCIVWRLGA